MSFLDPFADQVRAFSDDDLLAAYAHVRDEADQPEARTLLAEIERRGLPR